SSPTAMLRGSAPGRRRVRGKDCVHRNRIRTRYADDSFSARVSGHRAHGRRARPGKELIMIRRSLPTRKLRERPDLDQLRRQAKELVEAFVAGEAGAVAEVHAHYHDADSTHFALHDAQLVVARAYG